MRHLVADARERRLLVGAEGPARHREAQRVRLLYHLGMLSDQALLGRDAGRERLDDAQARLRDVAVALDEQHARNRRQLLRHAPDRFVVERLDDDGRRLQRLRLVEAVLPDHVDEQLHLIDVARPVQLRRLQLRVQARLAANEVDCFLKRLNPLPGEGRLEPAAGVEPLDLLEREVVREPRLALRKHLGRIRRSLQRVVV